jgi:hypothetical protein
MQFLTRILTALAMLAVTSVADQQADLIARIRANPTEDFSRADSKTRNALADADGMAYFQDHKDIKDAHSVGLAHAFKHHLIGDPADIYAGEFATAIEALIEQ